VASNDHEFPNKNSRSVHYGRKNREFGSERKHLRLLRGKRANDER
jgi:hypothetical protein